MNKIFKGILGLLFFVFSVSVIANDNILAIEKNTDKVADRKIPALKFAAADKLYHQNDGKLYVVNFWATWCSPCVEELPEFMEVNNQFKSNPGFEMILISLDSPKDTERKVKPFLIEKNIEPKVYILDDPKRMNFWILAVNRGWTGSIPATAIYRNGKQLEFHEGQLTKSELSALVEKYL